MSEARSITEPELLSMCRESLIAYSIAAWHGYRPAAHHRKIAQALQRVERGECKRLIICMPPRHGKSLLASENFPSWYLGRHPDRQIITVTYAQDFANDWGRKVRNQMRDSLFQRTFSGVTLADDSSASDKFKVLSNGRDERGEYFAVGVGGPITGRGAHLLLIDDPYKNREEADSPVVRKKVRDWYTSTGYTRLMPGGAVVLIQTRWHEDDLAGWLQEEHKQEGWEVLVLPAVRDEDTEPKALWPEQYPLEELLKIKRAIGPRDWLALYQQQPRPTGGGEFKEDWIQYYGSVGRAAHMQKLLLVDPSSGKRKDKDNDFTAMWVIGLSSDENYYVLDMVRDRLNLKERTDKLFSLVRKWRPYFVGYEEVGMQADREHMESELEHLQYRFSITPLSATVMKENRIRRIVPHFSQRKIWFPREFWYTRTDGAQVDLVQEFVQQEYLPFPVGRHDDGMDALARIADPAVHLRWPGGARDDDDDGRSLTANYGVLDHETGF